MQIATNKAFFFLSDSPCFKTIFTIFYYYFLEKFKINNINITKNLQKL